MRLGATSGYCGTSFGVLQCLDLWIERASPGNFSVIHFNWGLHDISPHIYFELSLREYAENLEELYLRFRSLLAPSGALVFATTTPVPPSYPSEKRINADVVGINAVAASLFGPGSQHPDVAVNDLYSAAVAYCNQDRDTACFPESCDCEELINNGVHFSDAGQRFNALQVATAIARLSGGHAVSHARHARACANRFDREMKGRARDYG